MEEKRSWVEIELQITNYELRVTNYKLQFTNINKIKCFV